MTLQARVPFPVETGYPPSESIHESGCGQAGHTRRHVDMTRRKTKPIELPGWPVFDEEQIEAVTAVLKSGRVNYWTGQECRLFEEEFAAAIGTQYAVAVANGTVALELALKAMKIGNGDEVVVPSRTFIATASAVVACGGHPVVADIDHDSQNLTAESIQAAFTPRTRAIIPVHLAGWPADMDPIMALAADRNLKVIEDCAQAHGAKYKGKPVGSIGDAAAFSFCQDKILTTGGEGGMLTTNDPDIWEQAWSYKDHGKGWDAVHSPPNGRVFKWLHERFGTNWRMTEMQAAIGRVVLRRLPEWVNQRRRHAEILRTAFEDIGSLRTASPPVECYHSYYKYYGFLRSNHIRPAWTRDKIIKAVQAEGIPCGSGSCSEIYLEQAFDKSLRPANRLPVARELGETSLMFLVHPTLSDADMELTAKVVAEVLHEATFDAPKARPGGLARAA